VANSGSGSKTYGAHGQTATGSMGQTATGSMGQTATGRPALEPAGALDGQLEWRR
jgi:hypothetical protein